MDIASSFENVIINITSYTDTVNVIYRAMWNPTFTDTIYRVKPRSALSTLSNCIIGRTMKNFKIANSDVQVVSIVTGNTDSIDVEVFALWYFNLADFLIDIKSWVTKLAFSEISVNLAISNGDKTSTLRKRIATIT
jgi:galactitol-specific phosphotransferase system IIC component